MGGPRGKASVTAASGRQLMVASFASLSCMYSPRLLGTGGSVTNKENGEVISCPLSRRGSSTTLEVAFPPVDEIVDRASSPPAPPPPADSRRAVAPRTT